ncbi:cytochrome P450 [Kitasatospora sp. NPDC089797]|uniref:cytochrome P450 n=1 Tax=Kitasatospora sp. NPDC089797 TaxID=3155298 RepID=UPI0034150CDB
MANAQSPVPALPGAVPLLGHLIPFVRNPMAFLHRVQEFGDLVQVRFGSTPVYVVTSPELLTRLLITNVRNFDKGRLFDKARAVLGNGLLTSESDFHLRQRRLIQPAFHHANITAWGATIHRTATAAVDSWTPHRPLDVADAMHRISLDVIADTLFAADASPELKAKFLRSSPVIVRGFVTQILYPSGVLGRVPLPDNLRFRRAARELRGAFDDLVAARRDGPADRADLISALCGSHEGVGGGYAMTDEQVRDEAVSVLLAGTETVATAMAWLFHELSLRPELQRQLRSEIRQVTAGRAVTVADLPRLAGLGNVLSETLRLHTPNWVLTRRALVDTRFGEYHLPAGADLLFSPATLHRDARRYPRPLTFDPERWTSGRSPRERNTLIPFGAGRRKCIGESFARNEMLLIAAACLTRWTLVPAPHSTVTESKYLGTIQPRGLSLVPTPHAHPLTRADASDAPRP